MVCGGDSVVACIVCSGVAVWGVVVMCGGACMMYWCVVMWPVAGVRSMVLACT